MRNEKQVEMGAGRTPPPHLPTYPPCCLQVCPVRFCVMFKGDDQLMKRLQTPPHSRQHTHTHTPPVLFTSSPSPLPLLLQHLAVSLPRPLLNPPPHLLVSLSVPPQCLLTALGPPTAATLSFPCHRFVAVWMCPD